MSECHQKQRPADIFFLLVVSQWFLDNVGPTKRVFFLQEYLSKVHSSQNLLQAPWLIILRQKKSAIVDYIHIIKKMMMMALSQPLEITLL